MRISPSWLWATAITFLLFGALWSRAPRSQAYGADARDGAPVGPTAFRTAHGTIITDSPQKARWAEARLAAAITNFKQVFGVTPGRGVIVEMPYASDLNALAAHEKRWTLPWMTRHFGTSKGLGSRSDGHHFDNDSGMQHELSHLFFTKTVVPNTRRLQYGGDAPDWLDEAAALSGETPRVKAFRRSHFHRQVCQGRLVPLDRFLRQQHPLFETPMMKKIVADHRAASNKRAVMMTVRVDRLGMGKNALLDFYAQSQAVAEFLAESGGRPAILAEVAGKVRIAEGQTRPAPDAWVTPVTHLDNRTLAARFEAWARTAATVTTRNCGVTMPSKLDRKGDD